MNELSVLVYDDQAEMGRPEYKNVSSLITMIRATLETLDASYKITIESNARKVVALISSAKVQWDLMILDVINENSSTRVATDGTRACGLEIARVANRKWPTVQIIFLTYLDSKADEGTHAVHNRSWRAWVEKFDPSTLSTLQHHILRLLEAPAKPITVGRLTLDEKKGVIYWRDETTAVDVMRPLKLTPANYKFLSAMLKFSHTRRGRPALERGVTINEIRGNEQIENGAIYTRFNSLKAALKDQKIDGETLIYNKHGCYRFTEV